MKRHPVKSSPRDRQTALKVLIAPETAGKVGYLSCQYIASSIMRAEIEIQCLFSRLAYLELLGIYLDGRLHGAGMLGLVRIGTKMYLPVALLWEGLHEMPRR